MWKNCTLWQSQNKMHPTPKIINSNKLTEILNAEEITNKNLSNVRKFNSLIFKAPTCDSFIASTSGPRSRIKLECLSTESAGGSSGKKEGLGSRSIPTNDALLRFLAATKRDRSRCLQRRLPRPNSANLEKHATTRHGFEPRAQQQHGETAAGEHGM